MKTIITTSAIAITLFLMIPALTSADTIVQNKLTVGGTTPNVRYWSANGFSFVPFTPTATFSRTGASIASTSGFQWFMAPVNLPHGASVYEMQICYSDTDITTRIEADIIRVSLSAVIGSAPGIAYSVKQASSAVGCTTTAFSPFTVDNSNSSYLIQTGLNQTTHGLASVKISYHLSDPLP